jgi:hypothetical protein
MTEYILEQIIIFGLALGMTFIGVGIWRNERKKAKR